MKISNPKHFSKIILVLVFSYLISNFSIKNVFLADSPKVRQNLDQYFLAKINNTKDQILAKLNFNLNFFPIFNQSAINNVAQNQTSEQTIEFLKKSIQPVTKGVSAAEQDGYSYTEFKLDEIEWAQITYTLKNGEIITIQYPKGTNPPPQAVYENQYE